MPRETHVSLPPELAGGDPFHCIQARPRSLSFYSLLATPYSLSFCPWLRSTITANGRRLNNADQMIRADLRVLLEDVRTRGDRQHPFWARVDGATGRKPVGE